MSSVLGGLKSLQTNEKLIGLKTSIESMTNSVRETLVDTWGLDNDESGGYGNEEDCDFDETARRRDDGDDKLDGNVSEETVHDHGGSDRSSVHSNNGEGSH